MKHYTLKTTNDNHVLFEGLFSSTSSCVEDAIKQGVCLDYVNLSGKNLSLANLDEGSFRYARFDDANLDGANMSGCDLSQATLRNTTLYNTCLCESILSGINFFGALFGGTDIAWAKIDNACFDTISALSLNFSEALIMVNSLYYDRTGVICPMSQPPVTMNGLHKGMVALFDEHLKIGNAVLPYKIWEELLHNQCLEKLGGEAAPFMKAYGTPILHLWHSRQNHFSISDKNHLHQKSA